MRLLVLALFERVCAHWRVLVVLQVDRNVEREVLMHSTLRHPNVIGFKRVRHIMCCKLLCWQAGCSCSAAH